MSVTGNIGNDQVEFINAATEDTLKQLLATMKTMNQSILKMGNSGGGSGGSAAANTSANQLGATLTKLNPVVTAVQVGFNILSNMVSNLSSRVGFVAGAFVNFATQAMNGTAKMSDFYGALSQAASAIPLLGGVLGPVVGLFQKMAQFQEANMAQYQRLTAVGINFGGSLTNLRMAASNAYMTLDDFGRLMSNNSTAFTKLGGTVNQGAEVFSRLARNMFANGGPGNQLLALGYTSAQVNQGMANYIEMSGYRSAQEMKNTGQIILSSATYLEQLDGLARITGKAREQQEEELKAATKNAAWQAAMAMMTPAQKEKAIAGMANALAIGGKGAVDAFQSRIMGIAPDKAGAMFIATAANAANVIDKSADMVMDGSKNTNDMSKTVRDGMRAAQVDFAKYGKEGLFAIIRQGGPVADALQAIGITANRAANMNDNEIESALKKQELDATEAKVMSDANAALKEFGSMVMQFLTPIIAEFTKSMGGTVTVFKDFMKSEDMKELSKNLGIFAKEVAEYIQNVFSKDGRDKIVNDLKYYLQLVMIEIKKAIIPWYTEADAGKDKGKLDAEKAIIDKTAAQSRLKGKALDDETAAINERLVATKKTTELAETISTGEKSGAWAGAIGGAGSGAYVGSLAGPLGIAVGALSGAILGAVAGSGIGGNIGSWFGSSSPTPEKRNAGSLGSTGNLFENFGAKTDVELHGTESVLTPDQMAKLVTNAVTANQNNNLQASIQQLNSLTKEMLTVMRESSENIKRNVAATKSLNRNLFPT